MPPPGALFPNGGRVFSLRRTAKDNGYDIIRRQTIGNSTARHTSGYCLIFEGQSSSILMIVGGKLKDKDRSSTGFGDNQAKCMGRTRWQRAMNVGRV